MEYCVYLTMYRGNRLPPFYVGSTSSARLAKGYAGSVVSKRYRSTWREERQTNPHLFKTIVIAWRRDRVAAYELERRLQKQLGVIKNPLYANLSYGHKNTAGGWNAGLPAWNKGRSWSAATRSRISAAKKNPSATTRKKLSDSAKNRLHRPCQPNVAAKISAAKKGVKLNRPSWHSGRTGVYSTATIEAMRRGKLGKPNFFVSAANKRRVGMKYRKRKDAGAPRPPSSQEFSSAT